MTDFEKSLQNPPKKYRPAPFWSWNENLNVTETKKQIMQMDEAGLGGFFMHARGGLQTEYLSDDWFDNILASLDEGDERGMLAWRRIYPFQSRQGRRRHNACKDNHASRGCRRVKGTHLASCRQGQRDLRALRYRSFSAYGADLDNLQRRRDYGIQLRGLGAGHLLPLRARTRNSDGGNGGHGKGCSARNTDQECRGT